MARKAVRARDVEVPADEVTIGLFARRVAYVGVAGAWIFAAVALVSFDGADWPSHTVAAHNEPTRNLCGPTGALVAYWAYHVFGIGAWVMMAGVAGMLVTAAVRRELPQPALRLTGLVLIAAAAAGLHALLAPGSGAMIASRGGLVAVFLVGELTERFSVVGTSLILIAALAIGAVVAADRLLASAPAWLARAASSARRVPVPKLPSLASLRARPEAALAGAGGGGRVGSGRRNEGPIDPDAGGIGATESFDPDEDVVGDEQETGGESGSTRRRLGPEELREKLARLPVRMSSSKTRVARDEDIPRQESFEGFEFPGIDLLEDPESNYSAKMESFVRKQAQQLEEALNTYGIEGEVTGIESGPVVTLYSVQLAPGTKVAKITSVSSDIARALRAHNIRIVPNMVGKTTVGIEVPNLYKERVRLKELMSSDHANAMILPMFLGKDASGEALVADLTHMPHMLIAGTTGSGKSVCINTIIMSWMYTKPPDELKLILVDPKMVEMSQFQDIPHLMCPVVTETSKAAAILEWAVQKMEERYELLREAGVRNIAGYNKLDEEELLERFSPADEKEEARIPRRLPYIVFIIDELADLIMTHGEVEQSIVRIAQKARAVGLHLILATQRPQANVVTGLIKSNMPCRASFKVASGMDSRIVLDQKGAELLLGKGDMLFLTPHTSELRRAQGTLVTDEEIRRVAKFLRQAASPSFEPSLLTLRPVDDEGEAMRPAERDPLFNEAVEIMIESGRGSVSLLQRRLAIGYTRASRLVDQMSIAGILGDHKGSVAREVILTMEEWEQLKAMEEAAEASGTLFETAAGEGAEVEEGDEEYEYVDEDDEDDEDEGVGEDEEVGEDQDEEDEDQEDDGGEEDDEYEYVDEEDPDAEDAAEDDYEEEEYEEDEEEAADGDEEAEPPVIETVSRRGRRSRR